MKVYETRGSVPIEETWRLEDIYPKQENWQHDYEKVEKMTVQLKKYDGNIRNGRELYAYLTKSEALSLTFQKVYIYAMLQVDLDTRKTESQALLDRASQLSQKVSAATSFFRPFLLSLKASTLKSFIQEEKGLSYFEDDLLEMFRYKEHVLSKDQEEIMAQMGEVFSVPRNTFGMINNADIQFGEVTDDTGNKVELTRGMYAKLLEMEDREKRKEAYVAYYKPYIQLQNTIATTLAGAIKNNVLTAKIRNYPSALEKALFADKVPQEVYDNLITTTKAHIAPMHRYSELRKEKLGLSELRAYDLAVPLVQGMNQEISFGEAFETMLQSLAPLGDEYVSVLRSFKENRYFDVREIKGKRSGAYNIGVYGVHPFILLNHRDDLDSLFTLAHESGHGMHSYFSSKYQPPITAGYSIFVAEVASTVNEILLIRYLLSNTNEESMKKHLLNHFIDSFKGTLFTQVMFAEFEKITHEKAALGEPLNAEVFNGIYENLFKEFNGDALVLDEQVKFGWARIPHFYRPFYVYKYATGYISAIHIADKILAGDKDALQNYLEFLKSGSSKYPLELLQSTGVDLLKPEPIKNALKIFGSLVEDFAALD